jgi:hypothetical protein
MSVSGIAYRAVTLPAEIEGYSQLEAVEAVGEGERLGDGGCDQCAGRQKDVVKKDHHERKSNEVKTVIARKRTSRKVDWRVWPITCWRMVDCIFLKSQHSRMRNALNLTGLAREERCSSLHSCSQAAHPTQLDFDQARSLRIGEQI